MVQDSNSSRCCQEFPGTSQHPSPGRRGKAHTRKVQGAGREEEGGAPPMSSRDSGDPAFSPPAGTGPRNLPKVTLPEWQNQTEEPASPAPGWPLPSAAQVDDGHVLSVPSPGPRGATVHLECDVWKLITGTHGTKELHFEFCVT